MLERGELRRVKQLQVRKIWRAAGAAARLPPSRTFSAKPRP